MKYRKKPVVVDALQWNGDNTEEVLRFCDSFGTYETNPAILSIKTLEGVMTASRGDYIIKGVNGEFYPCKPDIFNKTYEEA
jgi:hypothetical protein